MEYRFGIRGRNPASALVTALLVAAVASPPVFAEGATDHGVPGQNDDNVVRAITSGVRRHLAPLLVAGSTAVLNGTPTTRAGFTGLLTRREGDSFAVATGSLVCPNVVLTVAHFANVRPKEASFTLGRDALKAARKGDTDAKVVDSFSLSTVPGTKAKLTDTEASLDIALLKLDKSLDPAPAKMAKNIPEGKRNTFKIIGYGNDSKEGGAGTRREGMLDAKSDPKVYNDEKRALIVHTPGPGGEVGMPGDSGAPVFQVDEKGGIGPIIGIHSTGNGVERNTTALLAPVRNTLLGKLREWCPDGSVPE